MTFKQLCRKFVVNMAVIAYLLGSWLTFQFAAKQFATADTSIIGDAAGVWVLILWLLISLVILTASLAIWYIRRSIRERGSDASVPSPQATAVDIAPVPSER